ncbi:MAG: hypothetical protein WC915_00275 [archaeon]
MNHKGQTTIELLLVLSISMIALTMIYSLYAEQMNSANEMNNIFIAKSTAQNIVNAANTVYLSGAGSEIKVEIELPSAVVLSQSGISGRTIFINIAGRSDAIAVADVNIEGSFKSRPGKYVVYMVYDGNVVHMLYRDFELNKHSISFSAFADTNYEDSVIVRNNSSNAITFWVTKNFSHVDEATLALVPNDTFTVGPNALQQIDFNFALTSSAMGNYSGSIVITGQVEDTNVSRTIYVSAEALTVVEPIMIYPLTTSFSLANEEQIVTKPFSVCNKSLSDITDITWEAGGDIPSWFGDLPSITGVSAGACTYFDVNFNIPAGQSTGSHAGTLTANHSGDDSYTATIEITLN